MDETTTFDGSMALATGSLLPFAVIGILFAIGNYFLARRIDGASPLVWAVLSLIPGINVLFFYYVGYKVVFTILDRLPPRAGRDV